MNRREFIMLLGGTAVAWPIGARAQRPATSVVGFVHARSRDDSVSLVAAFREGLAANGYVEGQDVVIEYRFVAGQYNQLPEMAAELTCRPVAVLVTGADPAALRWEASDGRHSHRLRGRRRSGQTRSRCEPKSAGRKCHGNNDTHDLP